MQLEGALNIPVREDLTSPHKNQKILL